MQLEPTLTPLAVWTEHIFNVRSFGATGDGSTIDSASIQAAIDAAAEKGGTVQFPAGRYASYSIRLKSKVRLHFETDACLIAAEPGQRGQYDMPEPNPSDLYQDFGHNHWHNSLIWGEDIEDIAITGNGLIDGAGLTREGPGSRWSKGAAGDRPLSMGPAPTELVDGYEADLAAMNGLGNKAIALKNVRRGHLQGFTLFRGGHIAVLITGGEDFLLENLRIDSNRDGVDIDCVHNVLIRDLVVNTPNDDAIVLKSSYALGHNRETRNVTVTNCTVSGYDLGTMLDGSYGTTQQISPDMDGVTGRIKLGTESCGGFENISITNCRLYRSRGLAIECVDGGHIDTVHVENITMRDITTAPIFVRIGDRRRAPPGATTATARNITIRNVTAHDVDPRYGALIAGLENSPVETITLENITLHYRAGAVGIPANPLPELAESYPEPSMFGPTPAWGLYARHARNMTMRAITLVTANTESRLPVQHVDVTAAGDGALEGWTTG